MTLLAMEISNCGYDKMVILVERWARLLVLASDDTPQWFDLGLKGA